MLKGITVRRLKLRESVYAVIGSSKACSPCCLCVVFYGARVGNSFPGTPFLDCQRGQVGILGVPPLQGAADAILSHLVSAGASNHWTLGSAHMLTAPASVHAQVSELVTGERQRLGYTATTAVSTQVPLLAVQTSLYMAPTVIASPHADRLLTYLACACDPSRTCAGG